MSEYKIGDTVFLSAESMGETIFLGNAAEAAAAVAELSAIDGFEGITSASAEEAEVIRVENGNLIVMFNDGQTASIEGSTVKFLS